MPSTPRVVRMSRDVYTGEVMFGCAGQDSNPQPAGSCRGVYANPSKSINPLCRKGFRLRSSRGTQHNLTPVGVTVSVKRSCSAAGRFPAEGKRLARVRISRASWLRRIARPSSRSVQRTFRAMSTSPQVSSETPSSGRNACRRGGCSEVQADGDALEARMGISD
jgi:hypothetical protein